MNKKTIFYAVIIGAFFLFLSAGNVFATGSGGACLLRDSAIISISTISSSWPDTGTGYVKQSVSGATLDEVRAYCTQSVYDSLKTQYCLANSAPSQQIVVLYDANGYFASSTCGPDNMNCIDAVCPTGGGGQTTTIVPTAPGSVAVSFVSNGIDIMLTWADNSGDETRFEVRRRTVGGSWGYIGETGQNITSFSEYGFKNNVPAATYEFKVVACNSYGCSPDSNYASISTETGTSGDGTSFIPASPSNLRLEPAATATSIYLKWTDNATNEDKFNVERKLSSAATWIALTQLAGQNQISFTDATVASGTSYDYRVQACLSGAGCSGYSYLYNVSPASSGDSTTTMSAGTVSGYVKNSSGTAISNTKIVFYRSEADRTGGTNMAYYVYSASDGTFILSGITFGTYYIRIYSGNTNYMDLDEILTFSSTSPNLTGKIFTLNPSTATQTTGSMSGYVKDSSYNYIANAKVALYTSELNKANDVVAYSAYSTSTGFNISGITFGMYYVRVFPPSGTANLSSIDEGITLSSTNYSIAGRIFVLPSAQTQTYGTLSGYVKNPSYTVISGSIIKLYMADSERNSGATPKYYITSADTKFTLTNIAFGTYYVRITPPQSLTASYKYLDETLMFSSATPASDKIFILNPMTQDVAQGNISVKLANSDGSFGSGNVVVYNNTGTFKKESGVFSGVYTFIGVPLGTYNVSVSPSVIGITTLAAQTITLSTAQPDGYLSFMLTFSQTTTPSVKFYGNLLHPETKTTVTSISDTTVILFDKIKNTSYKGSVVAGIFTLSVPPGEYQAIIQFAYNTIGFYFVPITVSIPSTSTSFQRDFVVEKNSYQIYGYFVDRAGTTLGKIPSITKVFAVKDGQSYGGVIDLEKKSYSISVPNAGKYNLNAFTDHTRGYFVPYVPIEIDLGMVSTMSRRQDIVLIQSGSLLRGKVVKPDGTPVSGAWISLDRFSANLKTVATQADSVDSTGIFLGTQSDENGYFEKFVLWGTYYMHAYLPPERGLINPEEKMVVVSQAGQDPANLTLVFRSPTLVLSGKVLFADGRAVSGAFIDGWSEKGGYIKTVSGSDGAYSIKIGPNDTWYMRAVKEENFIVHKSSETKVSAMSETSLSQNLILVRERSILPDAVAVSAFASQFQYAETTNGARVEAPANSIAAGGGSVELSITPTAEAPSQSTAKPIGFAYDVKAVSGGVNITSLQTEISVRIPYADDDLKASGVSEEQLTPSYYDEATGAWKKADKFTIDKVNKFFIVYVNHLTRFALLAPADTTPPVAPTNVSVAASGDSLLVTWAEPTFDYHHTRIYRSTSAGSIGTLVYDNLTGGNQLDQAVSQGTTYFYIIRSVDASGNESTNTGAVSAIVGAGSESAVQEGDLIRGPDGIKVYIVNDKGYKRHIFNPAVFGMYAHFKWDQIKELTQGRMDSYITSDFYRADGDPKVFSLEEVDEAKGIARKRWLDILAEEFTGRGYSWDQVFVINAVERDYYGTGEPIQ